MALHQFVRRATSAGSSGPAGAPPPAADNAVWKTEGTCVAFPDGPAFTSDQKVVLDAENARPITEAFLHEGPTWTFSKEAGEGPGCLVNRASLWSCWIRYRNGQWETLPYDPQLPVIKDGACGKESRSADGSVAIWYESLGTTFIGDCMRGDAEGAIYIGLERFPLGSRIDIEVNRTRIKREDGERRVVKTYRNGVLVDQRYRTSRFGYEDWYQVFANHDTDPPPLLVRLLWAVTSRWVRWPFLALLLLAYAGGGASLPLVAIVAITWGALLIAPLRPGDHFWALDAEVP